MENYLEYTLEKLVLEKSKQMKYSKLKVHFKKKSTTTWKIPSRKDPTKIFICKISEIKKVVFKKNKTYLEYTLEK